MKKLLSLLIVSLFAISLVGVVSAQSFINPLSGNIKGIVNVEWENSAGITALELQYVEGICASPTSDWNWLADSGLTSQESYPWDTTLANDGSICLRLQSDDITYNSLELIIDNTAPTIDRFEEHAYDSASIEADTSDPSTRTVIFINADDNEGIVFCEIEWGDGRPSKDCSADYTDRKYNHQYYDSGYYELTLTIRDEAGHETIATTDVSIANVDPEITAQIDSPDNNDADSNGLNESAVGEAIKFTASGSDVDADLKDGLTCTWTFDGANPESTTADEFGYCEVFHTWEYASVHTVDLTISDKDGGSVDADQFELEVEDPEHMTPMQQVVAEIEFGFELDEQWAVNNPKRFKTDFLNPVTCDEVVVPNGMVVEEVGTNRCKVTWIPSNNQRGEHLVIVKVQDTVTSEIKYYSFDVTVYSWGIHLNEGWNLISIPYIPVDTSIDEVFGDIIENVAYESGVWSVFQYDAVKDVWYKNKPYVDASGFYSSGSLQEIVPGYGYWIKMDAEDWIYGIEENFNPGQGPVPSIEVATDSWNLIGTYATNPVNPHDALETLDGNWYSNGLFEWDGISSWSVLIGNMLPLEGYWLRTKYVQDRDTLSYDPLGYYFD